MKRYTQRQITSGGVDEVCFFLEQVVKYIVDESEKLLKYNGSKNTRISGDCVRAVLRYKRTIPSAAISRRHDLKKK